jgi:hypothetical protein
MAGFFVRGRIAGMKHRKLRIAWSVFCGLPAIVLISWWVRSYWWVDQVFLPVTKSTNLVVSSIPNAFGFGFVEKSSAATQTWITNQTAEWIAIGEPHDRSDFLTYLQFFNAGVAMPYWLGLLLSAAFAAGPWIGILKWRFSLRTLLIATTLVAVGLGLTVWATH